jgi:hypothetical protein
MLLFSFVYPTYGAHVYVSWTYVTSVSSWHLNFQSLYYQTRGVCVSGMIRHIVIDSTDGGAGG